MTDPVVRKLLPLRGWNEPPVWEVLLDGEAIGRIEQWKARHAAATFYRATAVDTKSGSPIRLDSSTDFEERFAKHT